MAQEDRAYLLNTDISFYIKNLDNHIQRRIHALYDRRKFQECSLMNMWVVDFLYHMELEGRQVIQKDVEQEFYINRATASKMLSLMEEKKLIRRTSSAEDSRRKEIRLEPRGLELKELCSAIRREIERQATACLSEEEENLFKSLCRRIIRSMED